MQTPDPNILKPYAAKYIWWKSPEEALDLPERIVAQVMDLGDFDDVQKLADVVGEEYLRHVITHCEAGIFSEKSWAYWHYRLGLCKPGEVPPMPKRRIG